MSWSEVERRNVECVKAWAAAWRLPGGSAARLVDEVYAPAPEVVAVLQGKRVAVAGSSKQAWKEMERRIEQDYASREVIFDGIYPCGDTVAVEARVSMQSQEGEHRSWPFAVFFTFDRDGRIVRDHTYMPDTPHRELLDETAAVSD